MSKSNLSIQWKPDRLLAKPAYIQIADFMTEHIQCGDWPEHTQLPSQRELAQLFGVNRSTLIAAMDELVAVGLVTTSGKGGTKVAGCEIPAFTGKTPDWNAHIAEGFHSSNLDTIQIINRYEFSEGFIRLSSGEPSKEFYPAAYMAEVLTEVAQEGRAMGYEEPKGMLVLREEICRYVAGFGIHTKPENVLIVSGALQAIQLATLGLLQPGSTVFLEKPSYLFSLNIFKSIGMRRYGVEMDNEGMLADEKVLVKQKHRQSLLYTVPNYHNPTGIVMTESRRHALLNQCRQAQIPIIEDDVYRELWIDGPPPPPIKCLDQHGSVLYIGSVSKSLSTGLRIGWLIGPEAVVDRLGDLKMQNDYGSSSLSQLAVAKMMQKGYYAKHNAVVRSLLGERRAITHTLLERYFKDLATWDFPKGGYYFWLRFLEPIKMQQLFEMAFHRNILAYPGYLYDSSMNGCLRISYSYATPEELEIGIRTLSVLARQIKTLL